VKIIAIEDKKVIEKIKNEYKRKGLIRDLILFLLSINTGTKLVCLLSLKVADVKEKNYLKIKDCGNKITRIFPINEELKELIGTYCEKRAKSEYLFASSFKKTKAIDRVEVFRKFKSICEELGLCGKYSVSSWRKTFGYHYYKEYGDLILLQWIYGQQTPEETLKYIGVKENLNDRFNKEFSL